MSRYRGMNNYILYKNCKSYIYINIDKLIIAYTIILIKLLLRWM